MEAGSGLVWSRPEICVAVAAGGGVFRSHVSASLLVTPIKKLKIVCTTSPPLHIQEDIEEILSMQGIFWLLFMEVWIHQDQNYPVASG